MSIPKPFPHGETLRKRAAKPQVDRARAYARALIQNESAPKDSLLCTALWMAIFLGGVPVLLFVVGLIIHVPVTMNTKTAIIVTISALAIVPLWLVRRRLRRGWERAEDELVALVRADGMFEPEEPEKDPFPEEQRTYLNLSEGGGWPAGEDLYYECLRCGDIIPSLPSGNRECDCGNIRIDVDYGRFSAGNEQLVRAFLLEGAEADDSREM